MTGPARILERARSSWAKCCGIGCRTRRVWAAHRSISRSTSPDSAIARCSSVPSAPTPPARTPAGDRRTGRGHTFRPHHRCFPTGSATVQIGPGGDTSFTIERPAAYDAVDLSARDLRHLADPASQLDLLRHPVSVARRGETCPRRAPGRVPRCRAVLRPEPATRIRVPGLVMNCSRPADVVKLNEERIRFVHTASGVCPPTRKASVVRARSAMRGAPPA